MLVHLQIASRSSPRAIDCGQEDFRSHSLNQAGCEAFKPVRRTACVYIPLCQRAVEQFQLGKYRDGSPIIDPSAYTEPSSLLYKATLENSLGVLPAIDSRLFQ